MIVRKISLTALNLYELISHLEALHNVEYRVKKREGRILRLQSKDRFRKKERWRDLSESAGGIIFKDTEPLTGKVYYVWEKDTPIFSIEEMTELASRERGG